MAERGARRVSRRTVLGGLAVGAAALLPSGARALGVAGATTSTDVERMAERLAGLLSDGDAARHLGLAYLETTTRWPTTAELVQALLPLGTSVRTAAELDDTALRDGVARRHRGDLRDGRFFVHQGWFHSQTAGGLAALTVLR